MKQVERCLQRDKEGKADERDKLLVALFEKFNGNSDERRTSRIPDRAGELFFSSIQTASKLAGLQADLNAAANIGLKAILDPDWAVLVVIVRCNAGQGFSSQERNEGQRRWRP